MGIRQDWTWGAVGSFAPAARPFLATTALLGTHSLDPKLHCTVDPSKGSQSHAWKTP